MEYKPRQQTLQQHNTTNTSKVTDEMQITVNVISHGTRPIEMESRKSRGIRVNGKYNDQYPCTDWVLCLSWARMRTLVEYLMDDPGWKEKKRSCHIEHKAIEIMEEKTEILHLCNIKHK